MANEASANPYSFRVFKPDTPANEKIRGIVFFIILSLIIAVQAFYWLFANSIKPFVLGMPFSMFFIVLFIVIEFIVLVILYKLEFSNAES